jgi:hypothetical protein
MIFAKAANQAANGFFFQKKSTHKKPEMAGQELTNRGARLHVLKAVCASAEGSAAWTADGPASTSVATLFQDTARFSVLGGRPGLARSLGSVYAMNVLLCLGASFRGKEQRTITMGLDIQPNGISVTNDGTMLFVSFNGIGISAIRVYRAVDGTHMQTVGSYGDGPLQFHNPCQVFVSLDDFVFVADCFNHRVQVLTPHFDFSSIVGTGQLTKPAGVCADAEIIAVSDCQDACVAVFRRADGALLRRLGAFRPVGAPAVRSAHEVCFMPGNCHIAVAQSDCVSVYSLDGGLIRRYDEASACRYAYGVTCYAKGDLIVAHWEKCLAIYDDSAELRRTIAFDGGNSFISVAIHGNSVFGLTWRGCVVYM